MAKIEQADFPQLGQLRYLPLSVGPFQARELALSLTEEGRIESFTYKSTKAPAQAFAASMADVAAQVETALEKRETEMRDDLDYGRKQATAALDAQIADLTKQSQLKKLQDEAAGDPVAAETASLLAQIANLEAKKKLLALQLPPATP